MSIFGRMLWLYRWSVLKWLVKEPNDDVERTSLVSALPSTEYRPGLSLTHISLAYFLWDMGKQCKTRSDAASEQVSHCLQTEVSFKI